VTKRSSVRRGLRSPRRFHAQRTSVVRSPDPAQRPLHDQAEQRCEKLACLWSPDHQRMGKHASRQALQPPVSQLVVRRPQTRSGKCSAPLTMERPLCWVRRPRTTYNAHCDDRQRVSATINQCPLTLAPGSACTVREPDRGRACEWPRLPACPGLRRSNLRSGAFRARAYPGS
jgi:hypothetical protein